MILYHYTSPDHLPLILRSGLIKVTESNLSMTRAHAGPDVVWLTTDADPEHMEWTEGTINDKQRIRIAVDVPRRAAQPWSDWAARQGMNPQWKQALIKSGGKGWRRWHVVQRPILASEWRGILDRHTGEEIELWTGIRKEETQP